MQFARQTAQSTRFSHQIRIKHVVKMDSDKDTLFGEGFMDQWGPLLVRTWHTWGQSYLLPEGSRNSFPELTVPSGQAQKQATSAYVQVCVYGRGSRQDLWGDLQVLRSS